MQLFLLVSLTRQPSFIYEQPVIAWIKQEYAALTCLDVDAFSDEFLITQAIKLLQEAEDFIIYFKVENPEVNFGTSRVIIEELIRIEKSGQILLEGSHTRISGLFKARPHLNFSLAPLEEAAQTTIVNYLNG